MKVILARTKIEAEVEAYERGIPPHGRDTLLLATDSASAARSGRGLMLHPDDVIELASAKRGRHYEIIMRTLAPAIMDIPE